MEENKNVDAEKEVQEPVEKIPVTDEELREVFTQKRVTAKKNLVSVIFVFVICTIILVLAIILAVGGQAGYEALFYAIGLAFLIDLVCVVNIFLETKEFKLYTKAIESPSEYRYLLEKEVPAYLQESEKNNKTIGGKKRRKFWG